MTTANKITLVRMAMIPVFIYFALLGGAQNDIIALVLFIVASATDFLDGYVARKYNQITDFGKFVDPLADKLLVTAALLVFIERALLNSSSRVCAMLLPQRAAYSPQHGRARSKPWCKLPPLW